MTKIMLTAPVNKLVVVGCGKNVVYLTSLGCSTDNSLQLVKTCYP